jgi:hypothetical protein
LTKVHKYITKIGDKYIYEEPREVKPINEHRQYLQDKTSLDSILDKVAFANWSLENRESYKEYNKRKSDFSSKYGHDHNSEEATKNKRLTIAAMHNYINNRVKEIEGRQQMQVEQFLAQPKTETRLGVANGKMTVKSEEIDIEKGKKGFALGTRTTYSGKVYVKTTEGWKPEKSHGHLHEDPTVASHPVVEDQSKPPVKVPVVAESEASSGKLKAQDAWMGISGAERELAKSLPWSRKENEKSEIDKHPLSKRDYDRIKPILDKLETYDITFLEKDDFLDTLKPHLADGFFIGDHNGDKYLIDTQGYDYARYTVKLPVEKEKEPVQAGEKVSSANDTSKMADTKDSTVSVLRADSVSAKTLLDNEYVAAWGKNTSYFLVDDRFIIAGSGKPEEYIGKDLKMRLVDDGNRTTKFEPGSYNRGSSRRPDYKPNLYSKQRKVSLFASNIEDFVEKLPKGRYSLYTMK